MHSFLEKDVHLHINDLPVVQLGFEPDDDADDASIRLMESDDGRDIHAHNAEVIDQSLMSDDYHQSLNHLHKNYKYPENVDEDSRLADSLVYDILKKGKNLGTDNTNILAKHLDYLDHPYVNRKYQRFIETHVAKKHLDADTLDKAIMTPDEINSVPSHWKHAGLRVFSHQAIGMYAEHHPVHGLQFIHHPDMHRINKVSEAVATENKTFKTHQDLVEHTDSLQGVPDHARGAFQRYTDDSAHINRYLGLDHDGAREIDNVLGHPRGKIEDEILGLDSAFDTGHHYIAHGKPFNVYTGVFGEHNIHTQTKRDEKGNIYFKNPSYTSTSLDLHVADGFARNKTLKASDDTIHRGVREIVSLHVPEWYPHARYIGGMSAHESEKELLLNRGQVFKIHPTPIHLAMSDRNASTRIWTGQVVPHDTDSDRSFEEKSNVNKIIHMMTNPTVDKDKLWSLANLHQNAGVRSAAAYHPNFPLERVDFLDHTHDVRSALLARKHVPEHVINTAIKNQNTKELRLIARRKDLAPSHFDQLFETQYPSVHAELAHRADLNEHQLNKLYDAGQSDIHTLRAVAMHPKLKPHVIDMLSTHPDDAVRVGVALNLSTPRHILKRMYASGNNYRVDDAIVSSPNFWNFKETK